MNSKKHNPSISVEMHTRNANKSQGLPRAAPPLGCSDLHCHHIDREQAEGPAAGCCTQVMLKPVHIRFGFVTLFSDTGGRRQPQKNNIRSETLRPASSTAAVCLPPLRAKKRWASPASLPPPAGSTTPCKSCTPLASAHLLIASTPPPPPPPACKSPLQPRLPLKPRSSRPLLSWMMTPVSAPASVPVSAPVSVLVLAVVLEPALVLESAVA
mmetsp:Transcript_95282/g.240041  ORF Transcript_95282/g.240041 Transcript_95282/m.240041 type:complete len:212 (-) Transcript_95282:266-901(-)